MANNISMLYSRLNKGKATKEVSTDSGTMATALQHPADSSFVQLANLILLRRDAYLDYVKAGMKKDTWLHLCSPLVVAYFLMMYFVRLNRILQNMKLLV